MKQRCLLTLFVLLIAPRLWGQSTPYQLKPILDKELQSPAVVEFQLQEFLMKHATKLPPITTPENWTAQEEQTRKRVLENVVYHGWPSEWVNSPPKFEDMGEIPSGKGYRLRKFRYEVVPGFYATALLYQPEHLEGKVPAVLNVMGHHTYTGKAEPFQQIMCINEALRGMVDLNLEWINQGELNDKENTHWNGGHLDLVGANAEGLFFLAMRRGLDYLWQDPNVDRNRIAVTGLSGGGWQTIILSSLDDRVKVSIPVAGYTNLEGRMALAPRAESGDVEQNAADLVQGQDYDTLTAIRAPRPTLEINNAEDDCCFRAPMVKPYIFEAVRPFYRLYGKEDALQFYQSTSISAHNYGYEDRQQTYRFFAKFLGVPDEPEIDVGPDVKTYPDLAVGVPQGNLTILGLARMLAEKINHLAIPSDSTSNSSWAETERSKLGEVVRYHPVTVQHAWMAANTNHSAVESASYRFLLSNGLSATGVWLRDTSTPDGAPLTVILNDEGKKSAGATVWDRMPEVAGRMDRSEQVLVVDLVFTGDAAPEGPPFLFPLMISAEGHRSLGLEAAQLIAITNWARETLHAPSVRLESNGIRSQVEALIASALAPHTFVEAAVNGGMHSLRYLLDKPVDYQKYPDLFCLDLYKDFDLDRIIAIAEPTKISEHEFVEEDVR